MYKFITLPSTNTKAIELAEAGAAHGEIVKAESQTEGRGRLGKSWQSPPGKGLYFSIIVRPQLEPTEFPKLTMTAGLAIAKSIEKICRLEVNLKWPNDIYLYEKKCGGILCEASLSDKSEAGRFAVIGVGLNVLTQKNEFPEELRETATSIVMETGSQYEPESLLPIIAKSILDEIVVLEQQRFRYILAEWRKRDFLKGKLLRWLSHSGEVIQGRSEGPDEHGRLMVRDGEGVLHEVLSGDVTLAEENKKWNSHI
jgi:BirA family biotin operon repressor/biotin-[acetyl-CoA-carboxylase] ligase